MLKEMHLKQLDKPPSPPSSPSNPESPTKISRKRKREDPEQGDSITTTPLDEDGPIVITEEQLKSLPTAFGKQKADSIATPINDSKTKADFSEDFKSDPAGTPSESASSSKLAKRTKKYLDHIVSEYGIPMKFVAKLKGHSKLISTMSIDRSGTRILSGSYDETVKFWDFGGMNEKLESFRSITPSEGYPVRSIAYNHSGSMFLCCTTSHKPVIYDRDGRLLHEFKSGDMYIHDLNHTFGHTMPLSGGKWFGPQALSQNVDEFATWSQDSTLRLWDMHSLNGRCKKVIKSRTKTGKRLSVTAADFGGSAGGPFMISIGCNDGSIQLFDHKSHCKRPLKTVSNAHVAGTEMSDLYFDRHDGHRMVSRGGRGDNTLKVWDLRAIREGQPAATMERMWNITSLSNTTQSPDGRLYITACSASKDLKVGKSSLCFVDSKTLVEMIRIPIGDKPINTVLWHSKINQLMVAGNDSNVRVFYEEAPKSKNGVLLCAQRKYKRKHIEDQMQYFKILNPNALRVYKRRSQIMAEKRRRDLLKHEPELPHYGIGHHGRFNTDSFTHGVYKSQEKNIMSQVDPRDRLLLFDDKAKQNQEFTAIYNVNQPKPVFQQEDEVEIAANSIVSQLYTDMKSKEPPRKKQKT